MTGARLRRYGLKRLLVNAALALLLVTSAGRPALAALRILALGDSLTAGYGLAPDQAFPARLEAWLKSRGIDAQVVNAGVSGDTSAGGLARLDWSLAEPADLVLLEFGANDALRGIDPALTYRNLDRMLTELQQRKLKTLLLGMRAPANWGPDYQRQFDRIYADLAQKHDVPLYPFFLEGVALKEGLVQEDGLHPNPRGVAVMVEHVGPYVRRLLDAETGTPGHG